MTRYCFVLLVVCIVRLFVQPLTQWRRSTNKCSARHERSVWRRITIAFGVCATHIQKLRIQPTPDSRHIRHTCLYFLTNEFFYSFWIGEKMQFIEVREQSKPLFQSVKNAKFQKKKIICQTQLVANIFDKKCWIKRKEILPFNSWVKCFIIVYLF